MPSPVMRIAPKPSRLTVRSPPNVKVVFIEMFVALDVSAPKITPDLPAKIAAPLARLTATNVRRVTFRSSFGFGNSSLSTTEYVYEIRCQRKKMIAFALALELQMLLPDFCRM